MQRLEAEGRPVRTGDDEIDRLVRDSILVLRMNLVELAKVADLCDDFRTRYVRKLFYQLQGQPLSFPPERNVQRTFVSIVELFSNAHPIAIDDTFLFQGGQVFVLILSAIVRLNE